MKRKISLSIATAVLLSTNIYALEDLGMITVTNGNFNTKENRTPFATEIFTQNEIKNSNASTIYEFLNEQSSINVMPSNGNIYEQKIDMRGFGISDGYQNIVVIVDGQRLNNIDMTTQLLGSIPIDTIEQIEIVKGSGSVKYGDGATSGVINIITNGKYNNKLNIFGGNNDTKGSSLSLGYNTDTMIINATWDNSSTDGNRKIDTYGNTDNKSQTISKLGIKIFPADDLELRANTSQNDIKNRYANGMTKSIFDSNPSGIGTADWSGEYYSQNTTNAKTNSLGTSYHIDNKNKISFDIINEDKRIDFITWKNDYENTQQNIDYGFNNDIFKLSFGINKIESKRIGSGNETQKNNSGYFVNSEVVMNQNVTYNFGIRSEKVKYNYESSTQSLSKNENLKAYDVGYSQVLNTNQSFFVNFNQAFQAPDVDRFFTYNFGTSAYEFNGYIKPAISKTLNIGFHDYRDNNNVKITLFNSKLENEIYYYATSGTNTNIDRSSKYGFEFFDKYKINNTFHTSLNYSYVLAKIDSENEGSGAYNDKIMPGVSKHNVTANFGGDYGKTSFEFAHKYKSEAYNSEDFTNNATQKQKAYNSTNLSIKYNLEKNLEIYAKVNNIFEVKNGMWIRDDQIFPFDFERTYYVGINATF